MARYPKGSSNNVGKSSGSVVINKTNTTSTGRILMTAHNTTAIPSPPSERSPFVPISFKWQPFGHDNMFPQAIAQLTRKSPTHRGILSWKNIYISGSGFQTKNTELLDWVDDCNARAESLQAVTKKLNFDILSSGNGYLEVVWDQKNNVVNFYHRDHTTCRVSKDGSAILIYLDWEHIHAANQKNIGSVPLYPVFAEGQKSDGTPDGFMHSIYHFKDYEPEFNHYGVPSWVSAMDAAAIAYKTNKWNVSRLDNNFANDGTLVIEGDISPKEAKQLKKDFNATYTGEGKTGKVFFVVKQFGGGKTEFIQSNKSSDGDWMQLHKQSTEDLVIAHTWFPSLTGLVSQGGLNGGNIQQMRTEYQAAKTHVIIPEQKKIMDVYKKIIKNTSKIDTSDLEFVNNPPFTITDLLDPKKVLSLNEQRELFGYEASEDAISPSLDGREATALLALLTEAAAGSIPRDTAKEMLIGGFGLEDAAAEKMLSNIGKGFIATPSTAPKPAVDINNTGNPDTSTK